LAGGRVVLSRTACRKVATAKIVAPWAGCAARSTVFGRICGGTLLSIAALVAVTLYQQANRNLHELRGDVNRLNGVRGELVR
jgi:hypothetical protein